MTNLLIDGYRRLTSSDQLVNAMSHPWFQAFASKDLAEELPVHSIVRLLEVKLQEDAGGLLGYEKLNAGKMKRSAFTDDELAAFTNMVVVVKDVARAIRDNNPIDMHPLMYQAVMDMVGFAEVHLMEAQSHLVDHKAQGYSFVGMKQPHRIIWLWNYLAKYHYNLQWCP
jgi:hypothetical protein